MKLLVVAVLTTFFVARTSAVYFVTLNTKYNSQVNLSLAFASKKGLSSAEKQAVLDVHNALRNRIALGKVKNTYGGDQPTASNMMAMEWDDRLAAYAQNWASTCPSGHSELKIKGAGLDKAAFGENMCGAFGAIERDMFGEVKDFNYVTQSCRPGAQCGHYVTLSSWSYFRIGCGWRVCKKGGHDNLIMVCDFAPYSSGGLDVDGPRILQHHQYWKGKPCSECPQGWNYCLGGGLCATKKQCESDSTNHCVCVNDKHKCEDNGGKFNAEDCSCKCPPSRYGTNCKHACSNMKGEITCGMTCGNSVQEMLLCHKSCGACGQSESPIYKYYETKYPTVNAANLKVSINVPNPTVPKHPDVTGLPSYGVCKNLEYDHFCEQVRVRHFCKDSVDGAKWRHFCGLSCNSCGSTEWTEMKKKAKPLTEEDKKILGGEKSVDTDEETISDTGWETKTEDKNPSTGDSGGDKTNPGVDVKTPSGGYKHKTTEKSNSSLTDGGISRGVSLWVADMKLIYCLSIFLIYIANAFRQL